MEQMFFFKFIHRWQTRQKTKPALQTANKPPRAKFQKRPFRRGCPFGGGGQSGGGGGVPHVGGLSFKKISGPTGPLGLSYAVFGLKKKKKNNRTVTVWT